MRHLIVAYLVLGLVPAGAMYLAQSWRVPGLSRWHHVTALLWAWLAWPVVLVDVWRRWPRP